MLYFMLASATLSSSLRSRPPSVVCFLERRSLCCSQAHNAPAAASAQGWGRDWRIRPSCRPFYTKPSNQCCCEGYHLSIFQHTMDGCEQLLAVFYKLSYFDRLEMFKQINQRPRFKAHSFFFLWSAKLKGRETCKPSFCCMFVKWCETSLNSTESLLRAVGLFPNCIQNNFFRW